MRLFDEFKIINLIKSKFPSSTEKFTGIGDDAALIKISDTEMLAISKDMLVEDRHFRLSYCTAETIAHKSLHTNLSDLAAMGVIPEYILLGLSIPPYITMEWIEKFVNYLAILCEQHSVIIIGGDTVPSQDKLVISITICGIGKVENIKYINKAAPDDVICVAGNIGYAHLGLYALEKEINGFEKFKKAQLLPEAKLAEGIFLSNYFEVTSMTDLSDGFANGLKNLCNAANVGAIIDIKPLLDFDRDFLKISSVLMIDPTQATLYGGEDYGLLFTVKESFIEILAKEFYQKFGYNFYNLGKITSSSKIIYSPYD